MKTKIISLKLEILYTLQGLTPLQNKQLFAIATKYIKQFPGFIKKDFLAKSECTHYLRHEIYKGMKDRESINLMGKQIREKGFDWFNLNIYDCGKSIWCHFGYFKNTRPGALNIRITGKILSCYKKDKLLSNIERMLTNQHQDFLDKLPNSLEHYSSIGAVTGYIFHCLLNAYDIRLLHDDIDNNIVKIKDNNFDIIN